MFTQKIGVIQPRTRTNKLPEFCEFCGHRFDGAVVLVQRERHGLKPLEGGDALRRHGAKGLALAVLHVEQAWGGHETFSFYFLLLIQEV